MELSDEMEQCIPSPNDVESCMDGIEIGRIISVFLHKQFVGLLQVIEDELEGLITSSAGLSPFI